MRKTPVLISLILGSTLGLAGCQKKEEAPPPPPPVRVENPRVGVAVAALSPDFEVADNAGASIDLVPAGEGASGTVSVVAGEPEIGGINLVAAVKAHKEEILQRPDGDYKGQAEYVSPLGTTFASRGRYTEGDGTVEELVVFMVHPWGDRVLKVICHYPAAADTQQRLDALMQGVVGELEGLPFPAAGADEPPDSS